ncbi:MAG: hypothetical protein JOZ81_03600, partial [Chloroflexi bacterium]|nr:hypothetical protein [Chloroflexota bacterium]
VYATCDTACTDTTTDPNSGQTVPANWVFAQISTGLNFNQLSLGFTSAGQPRAAGFGFNSSDFSFGVDYLECNANCYDGSQWSVTNLMPQGQAPLAVSLRVDGSDGVGVALSQSNQLWYWQCGGGGCADPARWLWTRWDGLSGYVQDADLAFDAQNQPHLALRSSGGPFGWGLAEMACVASCTTGDAAWTGEQLEDVSRLSQDLPQLLPANCTTGGWFGDFRPSLSLDPAGNLRVAFDNQFWVSGCSDNVDVRTEFEAVRVVYTGPALASSQARAATAAAAPSTAKQPVKLAASHGKGATVGQHDPARLLSKPGPRPSHTPPGGFGRSHQAPTRGHAPAPARARR